MIRKQKAREVTKMKKPLVNSDTKKQARPPVPKGVLSRLAKYLWTRNKLALIVVSIGIAIAAVSTVIASSILKRLIDTIIKPGLENGLDSVYKELISIILLMAGVYALGVLASFIYTRIMAVVTQGTLKKFRVDMFDKMETLPIKYYDTHPHGEIMSTYTNDTDALRQLIGQSIPTFIQSIFTLVAIIVMMIIYSVWLTLVVVVIITIMMLIAKHLAGNSAKYMKEQQTALAKEEGFVEEFIQGQKVVKVFNHENKGKKDFNVYNEKLFVSSETANKYSNIIFPIIANMGNIMYVSLAFVGGILLLYKVPNVSLTGINIITVGVIVAFISLAKAIANAVGSVSSQAGMIAMGLAGASRIFALLDEESEKDEGYVTLVSVEKDSLGNLTETDIKTDHWAWKHYHKDSGITELVELKGEVILENVDFAYVPGEDVLHDISFYAKAGQKIALVGATGAGKTTITNLINRFYDIPDGKIRYDGINIRKIRKPDLRRSLGVVLQDVNLFTGTVLDNIRYGNLSATDDACIEAAKLANAHDFITRLPKGYHTVLKNNGNNLSQGQRQLLSIARAAVADSPAMILDEATSSIDTRTEALVQKGMDNLMEGRTVFVIAHRLSTVRNSDAIMVMDHGRIIERGTHEQLIAEKGVYYQLYTGAFELE